MSDAVSRDIVRGVRIGLDFVVAPPWVRAAVADVMRPF